MNIELLNLIKSPDSNIREGAYSKLIELFSPSTEGPTCVDKNLYLKELCSKKFLFLDIDKGETNSSVARSFSLLVIGLIVNSDDKNELDLTGLIKQIVDYIQLETDFRGFDEKLGWIHILAHLGDLLAFLSCHKKTADKAIEIVTLNIIKKVISLKDLLFCFDEDKRLASGISFALTRMTNCNKIVESLESAITPENRYKHNIGKVIKALQEELVGTKYSILL